MIISLPTLSDISNKVSTYNKIGLNSDQKIQIKSLGRYIKKLPDLLSEEIVNLIEEITNDNLLKLFDYFDQLKNGNFKAEKKYDKDVFSYASSLVILNRASQCNSTIISNNRLLSSSLNLKNFSSIRTNIDDAIAKFIKAENINLSLLSNSTDLTLITTDSFSVYVIENSEEGYKKAKSLMLPYIDYTLCEKGLKDMNIIGANDTLYVLINTWNTNNGSSQSISKSSSITSQLINGSTGQLIDTTECGKIQVKMPSTKEVSSKISEYDQMKEDYGVDIFNSTDKFFNDLCISYVQDDVDITLENRRRKFNTPIVCSAGCNYSGLDNDGYII